MCRRAQVQSGIMNYGRQTSASSSIVSTSSLPHQRSTEQVDYTPGTKGGGGTKRITLRKI